MNHSPDSPSLFALVPRARYFRKHPTRSERIFWRAVCHKQLGVRVRRQVAVQVARRHSVRGTSHPLHPYIADFFVASRRLVIEIDGGVHASGEARARDARRDAELARLYGVRVLRIDAELVERDLPAALRAVWRALA